jgi:hypothetical protein
LVRILIIKILTRIAAIVPQKTEKMPHPITKIGAISIWKYSAVAVLCGVHEKVAAPSTQVAVAVVVYSPVIIYSVWFPNI